MGILAYKSKQGETFNLYGEGEFEVAEGVFITEADGKEVIYCLLNEQAITGKDGSTKDENGKASTIILPFPIKARLVLDSSVSSGKALSVLFNTIDPQLKSGFKGDINYSIGRSAQRISTSDLSNADFDLKGGLCRLIACEPTTQFELQKGGSNGGKTYKSLAETANERAALFIQVFSEFDKPLGLAYLKYMEYCDSQKLPVPSPLEFFSQLMGK